MNIANKGRLYAEIRRVLRPGGRMAMHEFLAGPVSPIHFPVPWARNPGLNNLRPAEEVRALIQDTGFEELAWIDDTDHALRWHQKRLAATPERPSPLSASTSCSAAPSARCSATSCATSRNAGPP